MAQRLKVERRKRDPELEQRFENHLKRPAPKGTVRSLGLGLITGAADDDPSAIGTYAAAGAQLGPAFLWTAPVTLPMMFAVVYLCSKLGLVAGKGLFAIIRDRYPKWLLYSALGGVLFGNIVEAGADLGGMAAALNVIVPVPVADIVVAITLALLALQLWGSYALIRDIFRWLALALLAYVGSALLARPRWWPVLRSTFVPTLHWNRDFLAMLVAVIGATLSAYLYTWQSNQDVEEDISMGRRRLTDRIGATRGDLRHAAREIGVGMFFSNLVMYFILLSTASTLFRSGHGQVATAADAARALEPIAGHLAGLLFAVGVVGVGFLAVPVMTIGAAYDLCQTRGWKHGLHAKPGEARQFYWAIAVFTLLAMGLNFFGFNPIRALVWAGIVQGFSTPFLLLLVMLITNDRKIMGPWVNSRAMNILGWLTTGAIFATLAALLYTLA